MRRFASDPYQWSRKYQREGRLEFTHSPASTSSDVAMEVLWSVRSSDDLVIWSGAGSDRKILGLHELRIAAVLFSGTSYHLLHGSYQDAESKAPMSLLDLSVHFGLKDIAQELSQLGFPPCLLQLEDLIPKTMSEQLDEPDDSDESDEDDWIHEPRECQHLRHDAKIVHWDDWVWSRGRSCWLRRGDTGDDFRFYEAKTHVAGGWPEDIHWEWAPGWNISLSRMQGYLSHTAVTSSLDLVGVVEFEPDTEFLLFYAALILGHVSAAVHLGKRCAPRRPLRVWDVLDLISLDKNDEQYNPMIPGKIICGSYDGRRAVATAHCVRATLVAPRVVEAACRAGADLSSVGRIASTQYPEEITLMDAAVLGGHVQACIALALCDDALSQSALSRNGLAFLKVKRKGIRKTMKNRLCMERANLEAAVACSMDLSSVCVNLGTIIKSFSHPYYFCDRCRCARLVLHVGGERADSLSLLDVAIWLGQSECADLLIRAGVFKCILDIRDLDKDSITFACSRCGFENIRPCEFFGISGEQCRLAACHAFTTGTMRLQQLFRQWGAHQMNATAGIRSSPAVPPVAQYAILDFLGLTKLMKLISITMQTGVSIPQDTMVGEPAMHMNDDTASVGPSNPMPDKVSAPTGTAVDPSLLREDAAMTVEKLSQEEASQKENADISEAILRSRIDAPPLSADNIVILRLSRHSQNVTEIFLKSPELEVCRRRLGEAGCEMSPLWASGAKLLVPLTQGQLEEARIDGDPVALRTHHVVVLQSELDLVRAALSKLPKRERPNLRTDSNATQREAAAPENMMCGLGTGAYPPTEGACSGERGMDLQDVEITVEATFLTCPIPKEISERSEMVESAPCGNAGSSQPANPRRWQPPPWQ